MVWDAKGDRLTTNLEDTMELSIVTGTYNRLECLKDMILSARLSIEYGIDYEFVVVDGGSTDGTIDWCSHQDDVVLISLGKLTGAVHSFNTGAYKAKGKYVILANDDIEFVGHSILAALAYMNDNPNTGIGCFYQDRNDRPWHVETMGAVDWTGKSVSVFYGQVCIVPKWLGDQVGWWGDYLYTYGGDNELSCNILELGYKIDPMPECRIHDAQYVDKLRYINTSRLTPSGMNADSAAWLAKWPNGPRLPGSIQGKKVYVDNKPRVVYAPIFEQSHALQLKYKRGLFEALSKFFTVCQVNYMNDGLHTLLDTIKAFRPHLVLTQFHEARLNPNDVKRYGGTVWVNWNGDYHPELIYSDEYIRLMQRYDLACFVFSNVDRKLYNGIDTFYLQPGYEQIDNEVKNHANVLHHDVVFLGNAYSDARIQLGKYLKRPNAKYDVGLYGYWPSGMASGETCYNFPANAALYGSAKIAIGDSQYQQAEGYTSDRLMHAMGYGAFLLQQRIPRHDLLGLVDGKNIVFWDNLSDLDAKITYYLNHPDERVKIAQAGQRLAQEEFTFYGMVVKLLKRLEWISD